MEDTGIRRRTSIRAADQGAVQKDERIKKLTKAQNNIEREEHEQIKMEVGVKAFVQGANKDSREFVEMERLAILSQQHERICKQLALTADERRNREMKICALAITGMIVVVAAILALMMRVH